MILTTHSSNLRAPQGTELVNENDGELHVHWVFFEHEMGDYYG